MRRSLWGFQCQPGMTQFDARPSRRPRGGRVSGKPRLRLGLAPDLALVAAPVPVPESHNPAREFHQRELRSLPPGPSKRIRICNRSQAKSDSLIRQIGHFSAASNRVRIPLGSYFSAAAKRDPLNHPRHMDSPGTQANNASFARAGPLGVAENDHDAFYTYYPAPRLTHSISPGQHLGGRARSTLRLGSSNLVRQGGGSILPGLGRSS